MTVEYDTDGLPRCPDCGASLSHESAGNRDTETMWGYEVYYFVCDDGCGEHFEVIDGEIFPSGGRA